MRKKLLTLVLSFVMVFTMTVPSFAGITSKIACFDNPVYTAWGDSMGAGCKTPGAEYQKRYEDYRLSPTKEKDWSVRAVPYTYVSKFADSINADEENSYNCTQPGLRTKDYCYLLGLIGHDEWWYYNYDSKKDENQIDSWSYVNESSDQFGDLNNKYTTEFKNSVKNADVITIELGANDITTYVVNDGDAIKELLEKIMGDAPQQTKVILQRLIEDVKALTKNYNQENLNKVFKDLCELKKNYRDVYKEVVEQFVNSLIESTKKTRTYWNLMMNYINENKKTGAIVIVTETPNPLTGLEDYMKTALGMDLTDIIQPFIDDKNAYVRLKSVAYDYVVADMDGIVLNSTFNENGPDFNDDWNGVKDKPEEGIKREEAAYSMHPNPGEHDKIFASISKAYKKELLARKVKIAGAAVVATAAVTAAVVATTNNLVNSQNNANVQEVKDADIVAPVVQEEEQVVEEPVTATATKISKLTKSKKSFTVKWQKKNVTGYQIQYSTSSTFKKNNKKITVSKNSTVSKKVKNLKSNKKYYVRVRTYKTAVDESGNESKIYSKWSAKKSVVTK